MKVIELIGIIRDKNCTFIISFERQFVGFYTLGEIILNDKITSKEIRTLKTRTHNLNTTYIIDCYNMEDKNNGKNRCFRNVNK